VTGGTARHSLEEVPIPFLTDIDSRAAIKGSRDPLGVQPIWTRMGRHVVGNLTTVSTSVRDFTVLLLGYWFAERVAGFGGGDGDLAVFLKWEQLAAYSRWLINGDHSFRGTERTGKNLQEGRKVRLGADPASQILSNQKTYGLWGLYTVPARSSGFLEGNPTRLTAAGRHLVESVYLPLLARDGAGGVDALVRRLAEPRVEIDVQGRDRALLESVARVLQKRLLKAEREAFREHLLLGGPLDRTDGRQAVLASAVQTTLDDRDWQWSPARVRHLAKVCRGFGERGAAVADRLERVAGHEGQLLRLGVESDLVGVVQVQHAEALSDGGRDAGPAAEVAPRPARDLLDPGAPDVALVTLDDHEGVAVPDSR